MGLTPAAVLAAQRSAGNAAVARFLARSPYESIDDGGSGTDPDYERYLREGLAKLDAVGFGRAEGVACGLPDTQDAYDAEYWTEAVAEHDHGDGGAMLVLKPGRKPSDAIDALFDHLDRWALDCAQFVQVAELYARRHTQDTEAFDATEKGTSFKLRPFESTGLGIANLFHRDGPDQLMIDQRAKGSRPLDTEEVLRLAPVGSRVAWQNLDAPASSAFRNENTVKLGADEFAAHGFGAPYRFTRREVEAKLAEAALGEPAPDAYIARYVFIVEIQLFKGP
jgi:hypothetical protein